MRKPKWNKDEVIERLEKLGFKIDKKTRDTIRPSGKGIWWEILERLEQNSTKYQDVSTKYQIEKPSISKREQEILDFIKEPKRFIEIKKMLGIKKGSVLNYLKTLQLKGLVQKQWISHKNVTYSST